MMIILKMIGCKTLKELERYLLKNDLSMILLFDSTNQRELTLRIEGYLTTDYSFTHQKNTRGEWYYLFDYWIYTEEQVVSMLLEHLPFLLEQEKKFIERMHSMVNIRQIYY